MRCAQQGGELASVQGAEHARDPIDILGHDGVQQAVDLTIRELDVIERLINRYSSGERSGGE
jgi:hypothetical protein